MGRILRTYVIREVMLPSLLAMLTITFILLMGRVFTLIDLLLQPGVKLWQVMRILGSFLPAMMVFAVPMSILIGTLIGVGRMTLDREILALRASGINLFSVFFPALVVAVLISLLMMNLAGTLIPSLLLDGMKRAAGLQMAIINSLEPGRFHERLLGGGEDSGLVLYFRERDPQTNAMKGVMLKMEEVVKGHADKQEAKDEHGPLTPAGAKGASAAPAKDAPLPAKDAAAPAAAQEASGDKTPNARAHEKTTAAPGAEKTGRRSTELTLVFAESGVIESKTKATGGQEQNPLSEIVLNLKNGTIHRLTPDPGNREYDLIHFDVMKKTLFKNTSFEREHKTQTNAELTSIMQDKKNQILSLQANPVSAENDHLIHRSRDDINSSHKELIERHAISLASFVFALIGIPLAIWIKPSGKSWGILLAIALMLVYYILMKMGSSMVEMDKPMGVLVTFSSNILFLALGLGFWWHSVRS